jgi:hypothetical protein
MEQLKCVLLLPNYSNCWAKKGCDKLPFYKWHFFYSKTFGKQSSSTLEGVD